MSGFFGRARRRLLGISRQEARVSRRGFAVADAAVAARLEQIGATFIGGYNTALEEPTVDALAARLDRVELERRGWAYEGAAMGLALLDTLLPCLRRRLLTFAQGPGRAHIYMVHVGAGWAAARLRGRLERLRRRMDPLLGWLVLDGLGFHEGFFHWPRYVERQESPGRISGYACRVFDQGLGRSLWFVRGADVERIADTVGGFDQSRRGDLWSGVGLACAYAGAVDTESIRMLRTLSGPHLPAVAQGAAFAAKARERAGNPAAHTDLACRLICECPAAQAAAITDEAMPDAASGTERVPAYELWRQKIQARWTRQEVPV